MDRIRIYEHLSRTLTTCGPSVWMTERMEESLLVSAAGSGRQSEGT